MSKRFFSIWFRYLKTDWFSLRNAALRHVPFVLASPNHGRMVITAANAMAETQGVHIEMAVADARAIVPTLQVLDDMPTLAARLLNKFAEWFIRYTPIVAVDSPDGLILDITGCAHLWGGEEPYCYEILKRLKDLGYNCRAAIADTVGTAWAIARFGKNAAIIDPGKQIEALLELPPSALRIGSEILDRLQKLGLCKIRNIISIPRAALRRRFGHQFLLQLDYAVGNEEEVIQPVFPPEPYVERLPCPEPIVTATGIEIALQRLLKTLCESLQKEQKGLRTAVFKGYRLDGKIEKIEIGTNRASHNANHLFKLFELKLPTIEPDLGIELFMLEAPKVEELHSVQEKLWEGGYGLEHEGLSELIDRLANKIGAHNIRRYLPDEHYWPERSIKPTASIYDKLTTSWRTDKPRPLRLLAKPEPVQVAAPIPDYPPMLFRYKGKVHHIKKADGPERIEQEWWLEEGQHRDYYYVEDEEGNRYWLFRSGHYEDKSNQWFLHGFFA